MLCHVSVYRFVLLMIAPPCLVFFCRDVDGVAQVWVVNKTGVALAYRAAEPKNDGNSEAVAVRRPNKACYRTDGDTMLFTRCVERVTRRGGKLKRRGAHSSWKCKMPSSKGKVGYDPWLVVLVELVTLL